MKMAFHGPIRALLLITDHRPDPGAIRGLAEALGIEVKYMGVPLTEMLKGDWEVLTF